VVRVGRFWGRQRLKICRVKMCYVGSKMLCKCSYDLDKSLEHCRNGVAVFGAREGRGEKFVGCKIFCTLKMFCKYPCALDKSLEHWWYGVGDFGARERRGKNFVG
jgi:hypothetical protein